MPPRKRIKKVENDESDKENEFPKKVSSKSTFDCFIDLASSESDTEHNDVTTPIKTRPGRACKRTIQSEKSLDTASNQPCTSSRVNEVKEKPKVKKIVKHDSTSSILTSSLLNNQKSGETSANQRNQAVEFGIKLGFASMQMASSSSQILEQAESMGKLISEIF